MILKRKNRFFFVLLYGFHLCCQEKLYRFMCSPNTVSKLPSSAYGADNGARTRNLNLGKVVLYQLSYVRIKINPRSHKLYPFVTYEFSLLLLYENLCGTASITIPLKYTP